jgi:hypothetical protein
MPEIGHFAPKIGHFHEKNALFGLKTRASIRIFFSSWQPGSRPPRWVEEVQPPTTTLAGQPVAKFS